MAIKKRVFLALRGGVSCAALGSLVGGCCFLLVSAVHGSFGLAALSLIPVAVVFAAITAAPFGFVVGSAGILWLAARAQRASGKRLSFEAAAGGSGMGATLLSGLTVLCSV